MKEIFSPEGILLITGVSTIVAENVAKIPSRLWCEMANLPLVNQILNKETICNLDPNTIGGAMVVLGLLIVAGKYFSRKTDNSSGGFTHFHSG